MRHFLPIKGPGGRALTNKEKAALVILSITLILFVLTLLAGDRAFGSEPARNPIFGLVAALARPIGLGIIAFYGVVLLWSGLLFFKGERAVRITPIPGRLLAALGITIGISGLLGIAKLAPAGGLGEVVGGAVGGTFGTAFGFPILLAMMILGAHLAGQGAWAAFRGASAGAAAVAAPPPTSSGFHLPEQSSRIGGTSMLPDDGDPSADERSLAVTRAMEEIERSKGVTIVEVDSTRTTIGEQVESTPAPHDDTEEAEVQRGLDVIAAALEARKTEAAVPEASDEPDEEIAANTDESGWYHPTSMRTETVEEREEEAEEAAEDSSGEEEEDGDWVEYPDEVEKEEEEGAEEEEELEEDEDEDEDENEEDEEEDEEEDDLEDDEEDDEDYEDEDDEPIAIVQPYLFPVASREIDADPESDDSEADSGNSTFDWRGRPVQ